MVKEAKGLFQCKVCGLFYKDKKVAEKCEAYCKKHVSCSLEIIKHAVKP